MKSMFKDIVGFAKVFIPIFLFFMAVGLIPGYKARDDVIRDQLLEDIELRKVGETRVLTYQCAMNNLGVVYSIDDNTVAVRGDVKTLIAAHTSALKFSSDRYQEFLPVVSALLSGASGGITLRSALKTPPGGWSTKQIQKTVVGVIATISGYSIGYYLGSHFNTDCDSGLFNAMINDPELWQWLEPNKLLVSFKIMENLEGARFSQTGKILNKEKEDPAFLCSPVLTKKAQKLDDIQDRTIPDSHKLDFTSEDFSALDDVAILYKRITASAEYKTLVDLNPQKKNEKINEVAHNKNLAGLGDIIREKQRQWDAACDAISKMGV